ncbi:MAG: GTPase Era [Actinobacteria bacterium]|nr:GTPase Era [Actinomycetota bacterium]
MFKSGFIGMTGRTNVGKSTIINTILNKNVVIVSDKPQTTRNRINCIYNTDDAQAIFVDCPGFFKPKDLLGEKLNMIIYKVLDDVDLIVVLADASKGIGTGDLYVFDKIKNRTRPKILALNKIDLLNEKEKRSVIDSLPELKNKFSFFKNIIPVSASTGENVSFLLNTIIDYLPEGPEYFPSGTVTDMPLNKMISEIIREKLSENLFEELPHSVNVEVESIEKTRTGKNEEISKIDCSIFVEKKSHKPMIIGKSGSLLKKTGESSRKDLEKLLGMKVYLSLWVKVLENWTKNEKFLNRFGFD